MDQIAESPESKIAEEPSNPKIASSSPFKRFLLTPSKYQISSPLIDIQELLQNRRLKKEALGDVNKGLEASPEQNSKFLADRAPGDATQTPNTPDWTPSARRIQQNQSATNSNLRSIHSRISGVMGRNQSGKTETQSK